jgi:hypothetical protein
MRRQPKATPAADRLAAIDWHEIAAALDEQGYATTPPLLTAAECRGLAALYAREDAFRSRVIMQRHSFGRGEYKYLRYPLPPLVAALREALYPRLAPLANRWHERLGLEPRFPVTLGAYLDRCHAAGQQRPTPLILKYEAGDYNCLHQDLYGEIHFPLQAILLLDRPGIDFDGGELILVEQRPRRQSTPIVLPLPQGAFAVIPVKERPVQSLRGAARVQVRHGVSKVRRGLRRTLGLIFHDAA